MIHLNFDSVIEWGVSDSHTDNDVINSSSITYRELKEGNTHMEILYDTSKLSYSYICRKLKY